MVGLFLGIGIRLVDFKVEFGRLWENDQARIVLADEISPDSCRLWDIQSGDKLDKDRFRRDLGGVLEAYQEVARRLGVLTELPRPRGAGPVLVSTNGQSPIDCTSSAPECASPERTPAPRQATGRTE